MIKATKVDIAKDLTPDVNGDVEVSLDTLKEMIKSYHEFNKKTRNIPRKGSKNFVEYGFNASQYVHHIICVTQNLIEQNVLESDPYGFLLGEVKDFGRFNKSINEDLIPMANELIKKEHEKALADKAKKGKEVTAEEKELTPVDVAKIASEPTEDKSTHELTLTTVNGKRWTFDKINFTLSYRKADGSIKMIRIAPEGSWRRTVLNFFVRVIKYIKLKYNDFKDRCIGIKQSVQFKWMLFKYNLKNKVEEQNTKDASQSAQ